MRTEINGPSPADHIADAEVVAGGRGASLPEYTLARTGKKALRFRGQLIAEAVGWQPGRPLWHEINLYRTARGNIIAHIRILKKEAHSRDLAHAQACDDLESAAAWLEQYDPRPDAVSDLDAGEVGAPDAVRGLAARARAEQIARDYRSLLGDLFYQLGLVETAN